MATALNRTVWFPKDLLLFIVVSILIWIPIWGVAGLGWGLVMALILRGSLIGWLQTGLLWSAFVWLFVSIFTVIIYREVSMNIPLQEAATLPERLSKALESLRYTVEQQSPTSFLCQQKRGLAPLFEFNKLHVHLLDGSVDLIGPAIAVNKVRKQLLASSAKE